jgi:hypothetical protein
LHSENDLKANLHAVLRAFTPRGRLAPATAKCVRGTMCIGMQIKAELARWTAVIKSSNIKIAD